MRRAAYHTLTIQYGVFSNLFWVRRWVVQLIPHTLLCHSHWQLWVHSNINSSINPINHTHLPSLASSHLPLSNLPPWVQELSDKMDNITKHMHKLDTIEASVREIKTEVKQLADRVVEIEKRQLFFNVMLEESKNNATEIKTNVSELSKCLEQLKVVNNKLSEEVVDLQCRSMRDNLLFFNIQENDEENCNDIIQKFCTENLQLTDSVEIDRAHRIGKRAVGKHRPIVVKFHSFAHREAVRKNGNKLKHSNFSIGEQFPKVVQERRRNLLAVFKQARAAGKRAALVRDKLYIDGSLYTGPARVPPT